MEPADAPLRPMFSAPLTADLVCRIDRSRVAYRVLRLRRLAASGLDVAGGAFRIAEIGGAVMTDWKPMPRVFLFGRDGLDRLDEILAGDSIVGIGASYVGADGHAHLTDCAVLPTHRGAGLHAALIRRRLADVSAAGAQVVAADTHPTRRASATSNGVASVSPTRSCTSNEPEPPARPAEPGAGTIGSAL